MKIILDFLCRMPNEIARIHGENKCQTQPQPIFLRFVPNVTWIHSVCLLQIGLWFYIMFWDILQFNINNAFCERRCRMATIIIECCVCCYARNVYSFVPCAFTQCCSTSICSSDVCSLWRCIMPFRAPPQTMSETSSCCWRIEYTSVYVAAATSNEIFYDTFRIKFELNLCILRCRCMRSTFQQRKRNYFRNSARTCGTHLLAVECRWKRTETEFYSIYVMSIIA